MSRAPTQSGGSETPGRLPDVTPSTGGADYSAHVLQAVMEMQRSLGALDAKVERLIGDVATQGERLDGLRLKMALFAGGGAVIGALIGTLIAVVSAIPWDKIFP